jgi:hypothetical protein
MEALKMETPMDNWNDDRLDELSRRMDEGFKEMREGFARIDKRFEQVDKRFEAVDQKFERLLHTLVLISWGFAGTLVAALTAVLIAAWI